MTHNPYYRDGPPMFGGMPPVNGRLHVSAVDGTIVYFDGE
jgi:hypothetical protein